MLSSVCLFLLDDPFILRYSLIDATNILDNRLYSDEEGKELALKMKGCSSLRLGWNDTLLLNYPHIAEFIKKSGMWNGDLLS